MHGTPNKVMNVIASPWFIEILQISSKDKTKTLSSNMSARCNSLEHSIPAITNVHFSVRKTKSRRGA